MPIESKTDRDIAILVAMAAEMAEYLNSDVLFWSMQTSGMPKLTLGGYLMRQYRLLALADSLSSEAQQELNTAVSQFNRALIERVVRFEKKAHIELEARIRQWGEFLRDVEVEGSIGRGSYAMAVETRAMMAAIIEKLHKRPYQLQSRVMPRVDLLDRNLQRYWEPDEFIWSEEWREVYPQTDFWWLYGLPKK